MHICLHTYVYYSYMKLTDRTTLNDGVAELTGANFHFGNTLLHLLVIKQLEQLQKKLRQQTQRAHRTHTHTEHARTHAHTHTFKHTHIHTHTHSHTHTHIHKHASKFFHSALKSVTFPPSPELSLSTDGDLQKNKTRETRQGFVRIADFRLYFPFL